MLTVGTGTGARIMKTRSLLVAATLFMTLSIASAQNEPSQDTMRAPNLDVGAQEAHHRTIGRG